MGEKGGKCGEGEGEPVVGWLIDWGLIGRMDGGTDACVRALASLTAMNGKTHTHKTYTQTHVPISPHLPLEPPRHLPLASPPLPTTATTTTTTGAAAAASLVAVLEDALVEEEGIRVPDLLGRLLVRGREGVDGGEEGGFERGG